MLTCGGFLLLGGRLGDLYGQRRLFMIGIALFSLASLACGLASAQLPLVIARALQGIGGAIVEAVALALLMNLFTEPAERAKAMGVYGFVCASGGSIGVLLGGVLTDAYDWHWIFLVNLPIGLAVLGLSLAVLPAMKADGPRPRLDVGGAVTVTAALLLAVYAIVGGNEIGWTAPRTLGLLGAAAVLFAIFIAIEAVVAEPLMPLRFFRLEDARRLERDRHPLVGGDVRLVLPFRPLHAARARLHADAGRPRLPAGQRDHGGVLARDLGLGRQPLRHPPAARRRPGRGRRSAWCCSPARRSTAASSSTCCPACCCSASAPASPSIRCCWRR